MKDGTHSPDGPSLAPSLLRQIDQACNAFEDACQSAESPRIEDYLARVQEPARQTLLKELLTLEITYRLRNREAVRLDEYVARFADQSKFIQSLLQQSKTKLCIEPELGSLNDESQTVAPMAPAHQDQTDAVVQSSQEKTAKRPESPVVPKRIGRYEIEEEIGRGGMGVVLRARDADFHRSLALKVMLTDRQKPGLRERFLEEAQIMGQLQHPGIAPVHELGELGDGRPYFSMKLIKGQTLAQLLREQKSPAEDNRWVKADLPRWVNIFEQICQTLAYAHSRGIIHRDLKPANIMVGAFGEVQVMDWGLAKVLGDGSLTDSVTTPLPASTIFTVRSSSSGLTSQMGSVLGTPAYMSPEQARGKVDELDARCDVFGLGAILCEVLTGSPPFRGRSPQETHKLAYRCDLADAFVRLECSDAPMELVTIAKSCLAKDPEGRPANAAEVADAVASYQASVQQKLQQVENERAAALVKAAEERRRRRIARMLAAALVVLAATIVTGAIWYRQVQSDRFHTNQRRLENVAAALDEAERLRAKLHDELKQENGVFRFLRSPMEWQARIGAIRSAVKRAENLCAGVETDFGSLEKIADIAKKVNQDEMDRQLALGLAAVHLERVAVVEGRMSSDIVLRDYPRILRESGLDPVGSNPQLVSRQIRSSPIREQLIAALDDWALVSHIHRKRDVLTRLLEVTRLADSSPLSKQLRTPEVWTSGAKIKQIADHLLNDKKAFTRLSPQMLMLVGNLLTHYPDQRVEWLQAARSLHPDDFWLNVDLGRNLCDRGKTEGIGYLQAALSIHPRSWHGYCALGRALEQSNDLDGAFSAYQKAFEIEPTYAWSYAGLSGILSRKKDHLGAVAVCRKALELTQGDSFPHYRLGFAHHQNGEIEAAIEQYHKALHLNPKHSFCYRDLGTIAWSKKDTEGAIKLFRKGIKTNSQFAPLWFELAKVYSAKGELKDAIEAFHSAIRFGPNHAPSHQKLGRVLQQDDRHDEAIDAFRKAIELDANFAEAYFDLGFSLGKKGDRKGAILNYGKHVELSPDSFIGHFNLGVALLNSRQWNRAEKHFLRASQLKPDSARAYGDLARAIRGKGDLKEAIRILHKAIQLNPKYPEAIGRLADVYYDTGDWKSAIDWYRKALLFRPDKTWYYRNLGAALSKTGDHKSAIEQYRKAIAIDPKFSPAWFELGNDLRAVNDVTGAIEAYRTALKYDSDYAPTRHRLSRVLHAAGKPDEAITVLQEAIKLDPKDAVARRDLGLVLHDQGKLDEAISAFHKAIDINPRCTLAYVNLGLIYRGRKQWQPAIRAFRKAIELDPRYGLAYSRLSITYINMGEFANAEKVQRELVKRRPKDGLAAFNLASDHYLQGCFDEARQWYRKALKLLPMEKPLHAACAERLKDSERLLQLDRKLADIRQGKRKAADAKEMLALADMCQRYKKDYRAAVELYAAFFGERQSLGEEEIMDCRVDAACAAVLAASGKGIVAAKIVEKDRPQLRQQASKWLKMNVLSANKLLKSKPDFAVILVTKMQDLLDDTRLASVRGARNLATLSGDEQKAWRQLWVDVRQFLNQAHEACVENWFDGVLTKTQTARPREVGMTAGKTYVVEMHSTDFDSAMRLEDAKGKKLAENDDIDFNRSNLDSRIVFTPKHDGVYRIVATSWGRVGRGDYVVFVRGLVEKK